MSTRFQVHVGFLAALLMLSPVPSEAAARELPLIEGVKSGDVAAVRARLPQADVNATEEDGTTALHWAVHRDNFDLTDLLIKSGANVKSANRYGMTPLGLAATNGNARIIERLLAAGVDANSTLPGGETALMTVARADRVDALKVLIAKGANVNARETFRGQTPLMWAASRGNLAVVNTLLAAGADINARTPKLPPRDPNGDTDFRQFDDAGGQTGWQWTATEPTAFSALMFAVRAGRMEIVRTLLDKGASANDVLSDGTSALILAITNAHYELATYLMDRGADVNAAEQGWTALHQAIRNRRTNTRSYTPPTPTGKIELAEFIPTLIDRGAHVNVRMWKNGLKSGQRERFNYRGATPFLIAAKIGDVEMMRLLLDRGANPKITNVDDENALMVAAGVALFNPGEDAGSNPEHMADRLEAIKLCVKLGLDVNALSKTNENPLHGAAYLGDPAIVEYLVAQGAKMDVKNDRGWTPLMICNGVAYAEFYKEQPELAVVFKRLMAARGLETENQIGDQKTCKECLLTRGSEAARVIERDLMYDKDVALIASLRSAK